MTTAIHPSSHQPHRIRMPLLAAAAGLATITGVAAAVTLIGDDDPTVVPAAVDATPLERAYTPDQLAASIESMLAATADLVDPTQTPASAPGTAAPAEPAVDPVEAAAIADLQSNAVGLPPAP